MDWQQRLWAAHLKRADDLFKMSLAAAYASLFFLIELETLIPRASGCIVHLMNAAWLSAWIAVLGGSLHATIEVLHPAKSIAAANDLMRRANSGHSVSAAEVDSASKPGWLWFATHRMHLAGLVGVFSFAAAYRSFNQ